MLKIHLLILFGYVFYSKAQQPIIHLASFNNRMIPHLLQALIKEQSNVVYSPFGLTTSLSVIFEGIDDKVAEELCKILGLAPPRNTRENLRTGMKILLEYMQTQQKKNLDGTVGQVNKAHVNSPEPLIAQYQNLLNSYYKTEIHSNITNNSELIFEYLSDTKVMSHWKDYDKLAVYTYLSHQASGSFMTPDGEVVHVPMIPQVGLFRAGYHPKLSSQIVEIPLGQEMANLVLVMPDNKDGMEDLLQKMLEVDLSTLTRSLPSDEVEVALPQFALVNSDIDLGRILRNSGLGVIFAPSAKNKRGSSRALGGKGPVKTLKQNVYITTSFTSINSLAATTSILTKTVKKAKKPRIRLIQETINVEPPKIEQNQPEPEEVQENQPKEPANVQENQSNPEEIQSNPDNTQENQSNPENTQENQSNPENTQENQSNLENTQENEEIQEKEEEIEQENQGTEERVKREASQTYVFNKPFIFLIYHGKSGIVLLAGAVKRPTQVPNIN